MKAALIGYAEAEPKDLNDLGKGLASLGVSIRSSGVKLPQSCYETYGLKAEAFITDDVTKQALELAAVTHPAWKRINLFSKQLLARDCQIILGRYLDDPVDFVICWTKLCVASRTAFGIKLAEAHGIEVINLTKKNFPWWQFKSVPGGGYERRKPRRTKRRAFLCMNFCESLEDSEIKSFLQWERRSLKELLESDRLIGMIDGLLNEVSAPDADGEQLNTYGRLSRFLNSHPELSIKRTSR